MIFPETRLALSGERFTVHYRLVADTEAKAAVLARGICLEQTVETSDELLADDDIRRYVVGRIEALEGAGSGRYDVAISYAVESAAGEFTQLLNVIFGNTAMQPGIRVMRLDLPEGLLRQFKGPRFGRAGIRALTGLSDRALLGTAIKPMGLPAAGPGRARLPNGPGWNRYHQGRSRPDQPALRPFCGARAAVCGGGRAGQPRDRLSLPLRAERDLARRSDRRACSAGQGLGRGRRHGGAGTDGLGHPTPAGGGRCAGPAYLMSPGPAGDLHRQSRPGDGAPGGLWPAAPARGRGCDDFRQLRRSLLVQPGRLPRYRHGDRRAGGRSTAHLPHPGRRHDHEPAA